jgi:hypothetical protein
MVKAVAARRKAESHTKCVNSSRPSWTATLFRRRTALSTVDELTSEDRNSTPGRAHGVRVRPDMICKLDDAPKLVNPSGWISEGMIGER